MVKLELELEVNELALETNLGVALWGVTYYSIDDDFTTY
jgi:hypothetical protein